MFAENRSHKGPKSSKEDQGACASLNNDVKQSSEHGASKTVGGEQPSGL